MNSWFLNLTIAKKLQTAFSAGVLLLVIIGIISIITTQIVSRQTDKLYSQHLKPLEQINNISTNFLMARVYLRDALYHAQRGDKAAMQSFQQKSLSYLSNAQESAAIFEKSLTDAEAQRLFREYQAEWNSFVNVATNIAKLTQEERLSEAVEQLITICIPAAERVNALVVAQLQHKKYLGEETRALNERIAYIMLGIACVCANQHYCLALFESTPHQSYYKTDY